MTPEIIQVDTAQVTEELKPVEATVAEPIVESPAEAPRLRPEVRAAFEASWKRNEAAYRYLGR